MAVRVGINGFGRIGRNIMRAAMGNPAIDFVAVNDLTNAATLAHLLKYDSVLGNLDADVKPSADGITVDGDEFKVLSMKDPAQLPWKDLGVDVVFESTGIFATREGASKHIAAGREEGDHHGAGEGARTSRSCWASTKRSTTASKHHIISNASCTTNCLAPLAKVIHEKFGITKGWMTTIHSYTNDQNLLDLPHKDLRRARAAALSMIPTTTGAATAVGEVLPELKGRLDGFAMRVPTPNVSVVDLNAVVDKKTTAEEVNAALREAANGPLKGILAVLGSGARLDRLQGQPELVDRRCALHQGDGRRLREGALLVRQRVGLLEPLRRSAARRSSPRACEEALDPRPSAEGPPRVRAGGLQRPAQERRRSATTPGFGRRCRRSPMRSTQAPRAWCSRRILADRRASRTRR